MRAVILVAGRGTRISRHIQGKPKCCVEFDGVSLIKRTIRCLENFGIKDIAIVTGYKNQTVLDQLCCESVKIYHNPFFHVTNSIASIWFAKEFFKFDDTYLVINGDLFIEDNLMEKIINENLSPVFFADSSRIEEADYKFNWQDKLLKSYGKELDVSETTGEYIGIAKFNSSSIKPFLSKLDLMIDAQLSDAWWEDVFYSFVNDSNKSNIYVSDVKGIFWAELDFVEDYNRIEAYLSSKKGVND